MAQRTKVRRGFADSPYGQVHYVTAGSGRPIVFVHPSPMSWNYYYGVVPLVADAGFQFVGMDTMGYGDSERPDPPFTSIAQYAETVVALLDGLNLEKPYLVGHQTGTAIVNEVAAGWPDLPAAIVLSEVFNWNKPERRAVHEKRHKFFPPRPDGSHLMDVWNRHSEYALKTGGTALAERFFFNQYRVNFGEQPVAAYGTMGWDGSAPWNMCRYEIYDRAPLITAPALLLHGTTSDLRRIQPALQKLIPNAQAASYESQGIGGPLDDLHGSNGVILDFCRQHD